MSLPPIVSVTLQGVVLSATSNLLAQALTSFRDDVRCPWLSRSLLADG